MQVILNQQTKHQYVNFTTKNVKILKVMIVITFINNIENAIMFSIFNVSQFNNSKFRTLRNFELFKKYPLET